MYSSAIPSFRNNADIPRLIARPGRNNDEHNELKLITNLIILLLQIIIDNQFVSTIMDNC